MSDYFVGEIRMFAFDWAPQTWAICDGSLLPVNQYVALYSLCGNYYGGNTSQFAIPDLRGRVPVSQTTRPSPTVYAIGTAAGAETVALTTTTIPAHTHSAMAVSNVPAGAAAIGPANNLIATVQTAGHPLYAVPTNQVPLGTNTISTTGGGQGHNNMQPFAVMNYCIALQGIYPPRN